MAGLAGLQMIGARKLTSALRRMPKELSRDAAKKTRSRVEDMMTTSRRQVPVATGNLKGTAFVRGPKFAAGNDWTIEAGYGAKYALYVHEIPPPEVGAPNPRQIRPGTRTARHKSPTKWKFLQDPAEEMFGKFEAFISKDRGLSKLLDRLPFPRMLR